MLYCYACLGNSIFCWQRKMIVSDLCIICYWVLNEHLSCHITIRAQLVTIIQGKSTFAASRFVVIWYRFLVCVFVHFAGALVSQPTLHENKFMHTCASYSLNLTSMFECINHKLIDHGSDVYSKPFHIYTL